MKNNIIVALALSVSVFSFAQKKELKLAEKAIKAKNFSQAATALLPVESLVGSLDDNTKNKYYYLKSVALFANGEGKGKDLRESVKAIKKVRGKEYRKQSNALKQSISNKLIIKANSALEKKKYAVASNNFEQVYNLKRKDTSYLFYAAATAYSVPNYDKALKLFTKLQDLGYTGIETKYLALNKATQKTDEFSSKNARDIAVKTKTHIVPTQKVSESKKADIIKNIGLIHIAQGNNEKAITAIKTARETYPDDISLVITEANLHYKMGHTEEFKNLLTKATSMDPNNADLQYNLGVISAESKDIEAAKAYYEKAIEINPNHVNAYINKAGLILGQEPAIIEEMNSLGTSRADNAKYDILKAKRENVLKSTIPIYEKVLSIDSKNQSAASTLIGVYTALGNTAKANELKAKLQ